MAHNVMVRKALGITAAALWAAFSSAQAQVVPGLFPSGAIYGNPTGSEALPRTALPGDFGIQLASITTNVPITPTTPIGASSTWVSSCFPATSNDRIDFAATLSQSGTLKINRYLGAACTVPIPGGPVQQAATTTIPAVVSASDGAAFRGYTVQIDNTTATPSNVTNSALLQTTSANATGNPAYTDQLGNQTQPVTPMCDGLTGFAPCSQGNPLYTIVNNGTVLGGGEAHLGETGTNQLLINVNVPLTGAFTYATGQSIGGLISLAGMTRTAGAVGTSGSSGQILSTMLTMRESTGSPPGAVDVMFFERNPNTTGTLCTDHNVVNLNFADGSKMIGIVHLTDISQFPATGGANTGSTIWQVFTLPIPYSLASTTTVFACIVAKGAVIATSAGASNLRVGVLRQ